VLQFVCNVIKDTGKEEYLRPFIRIGLDWIVVYFNYGKNHCTGYLMCLCYLFSAKTS